MRSRTYPVPIIIPAADYDPFYVNPYQGYTGAACPLDQRKVDAYAQLFGEQYLMLVPCTLRGRPSIKNVMSSPYSDLLFEQGPAGYLKYSSCDWAQKRNVAVWRGVTSGNSATGCLRRIVVELLADRGDADVAPAPFLSPSRRTRQKRATARPRRPRRRSRRRRRRGSRLRRRRSIMPP